MNRALLSSDSSEYRTPDWLFGMLDDEFHFDLDAAASAQNAKCRRYYDRAQDGLAQPWAPHTVFCNPPYGREIKKWVKKAHDETDLGATVVMIIPARTDTSYFHDYILGRAEVRFLRGRIRYLSAEGAEIGNSPFPTAVIIFRPKRRINP